MTHWYKDDLSLEGRSSVRTPMQLSGYGYRWFRSSALHPGEGGEED